MVSIAAHSDVAPGGGFSQDHRWDRNFFLLWIALIWTGILMGFGKDIVNHFKTHAAAYPLIVHIHAAAFVGWLLLLTGQILLIRARRPDIHMRLGVVAVFLAPAMVVLGPMTAIIVGRAAVGTPQNDPAFLSVQLAGMLVFGALVAAGLTLRGAPSAHKRLMLLATLALTDAGFARWLGGPLTRVFGSGVGPMWLETYSVNFALVLGLGVYDLITRRRLHPAYVAGASLILTMQITAAWLYYQPAWKLIAVRIIGH